MKKRLCPPMSSVVKRLVGVKKFNGSFPSYYVFINQLFPLKNLNEVRAIDGKRVWVRFDLIYLINKNTNVHRLDKKIPRSDCCSKQGRGVNVKTHLRLCFEQSEETTKQDLATQLFSNEAGIDQGLLNR